MTSNRQPLFLPVTHLSFRFGFVKLMSTNQDAWNGHACYHYSIDLGGEAGKTNRYINIGVCTKCFNAGPVGYDCRICHPLDESEQSQLEDKRKLYYKLTNPTKKKTKEKRSTFTLLLDQHHDFINPIKILSIAQTNLWSGLSDHELEQSFHPTAAALAMMRETEGLDEKCDDDHEDRFDNNLTDFRTQDMDEAMKDNAAIIQGTILQQSPNPHTNHAVQQEKNQEEEEDNEEEDDERVGFVEIDLRGKRPGKRKRGG